jgi:hypothetical protein
MRSRNQYA